MTSIFSENFPEKIFEQLDYCKCFAMKNSFLERTKSIDYYQEGFKRLVSRIPHVQVFIDRSNLEYQCSRKSIFRVLKSYRTNLRSRIAAIGETRILERIESYIVWPVYLRSFFNLSITATWWSHLSKF